MIRIPLFSLIGVVVVFVLGFSLAKCTASPLHWFGHKKAPALLIDDEKPSFPNPLRSSFVGIEKIGHATTQATTRAFGEMKEAHERRKTEATTMPHPMREGLHEVREGLGHATNGVIQGIRKRLVKPIAPTTQPSATTQPSLDE